LPSTRQSRKIRAPTDPITISVVTVTLTRPSLKYGRSSCTGPEISMNSSPAKKMRAEVRAQAGSGASSDMVVGDETCPAASRR